MITAQIEFPEKRYETVRWDGTEEQAQEIVDWVKSHGSPCCFLKPDQNDEKKTIAHKQFPEGFIALYGTTCFVAKDEHVALSMKTGRFHVFGDLEMKDAVVKDRP